MAIVDRPDGSFVLVPNPRKVTAARLILVVITVALVGLGIAFVQVTLGNPTFTWPTRLLLPAILGVIAVGVWYRFRPAVLKVDAIEISYDDGVTGRRMSRSELSIIFRGQVSERSRLGDVWGKGYVFARSDGRVGLVLHTYWFSDDRIAEFAQRLQVPIRGDFSVKVKDRVEPTST